MPDSDKARGQAVKQEPADELDGGYRDLFGAIFLAVFNREGLRMSCISRASRGTSAF